MGDKEDTLKTEDNDKAPYQLGTYSRQRAIESGKIIEKTEFSEIKIIFWIELKLRTWTLFLTKRFG